MRILAIDAALPAVSACVLDSSERTPLASETLAMARGHAEALMPLIERVVGATDGGFAALDRIAVTVGPGSFTGIRVGLSAARAIGLALGKPVVGVSTLNAFAAPLILARDDRRILACVDARHGQSYAQLFGSNGQALGSAAVLRHADAVALFHRCHARAQSNDDADGLVTRDEGQGGLERPIALGGVQVGVTDAAGLGLDQDLARAGGRDIPFLDLQRFLERRDHGALHLGGHC